MASPGEQSRGAEAAAAAPSDNPTITAAAESGASAPPPGPIDYAELYDQIKGKPCKVERINQERLGFREGDFRTRSDIIERELAPIYNASTLEEVHRELEAAHKRLSRLGVFSSVSFLAHEEPLDEPSACTVEVELAERNWYRLRAGTYVQGGESTMEAAGELLNATGRCEHLTASVEYGTEMSHTGTLSYSQPRILGKPIVGEVRLQQLFRNNQKASSYTEQLRGVLLGIRSMSGSQALEYELGWRRLLDPGRTASKAVVAQMGDYLKSSLRYTAMLDRREPGTGGVAATLGGPGWALRSTTELAGLAPPDPAEPGPAAAAAGAAGLSGSAPGGTLRYMRQQVDASMVVPMDPQGAVVFNLGATAGLLLPWSPGEIPALTRTSCIADRFFIGGPSSLRGFKFKGVGPTDTRRPPAQRPLAEESQPLKRDALGGDAFASVFAGLMFQLPHPALQLLKVHGHAWINGGNVVQVAGTGRSPGKLLSDFGSTFRWSCGLGLVVPTVFGRFEANYCVVLSAQEHDRAKRGLQLGFAANPLA